MKKLIGLICVLVCLFFAVPMLNAKGNTWSREKRKIKGCFIESVDVNYHPVGWWYKLFEEIIKPRG